ncbi:unnamed protein product [Acanthoscelides obtectus]|uniref:Zinc finger PHD-type domain-containing protein n=1 Tax=Acanthoscelides obtectus TaxID=200917 RepID=A0A9P0LJQ8_ACAOB|nr:unnamed protein product [Acanthoscelides obtectus]CAK1635010.1 hypothetical protein AOBTE_LOCUS8996 [Acanthoscelides obtectus]
MSEANSRESALRSTFTILSVGWKISNPPSLEDHWDSEDEIPLAQLIEKEAQCLNNSFAKELITPDMQPVKTKPRKKALNYRAQEVKRDVFKDPSSKKIKTSESRKSTELPTTSRAAREEDWMCSVCDKAFVADMRSCVLCGIWVHEECVGLTANDTEEFTCPQCLP